MDYNTVRVIRWHRFSELLHTPLSCGVRRDIDVKESAAGMFNEHKHIENAKRRGDRHTEITRDDALGMIADKRGPVLRLAAWAAYTVPWHVFVHRSG